MRRAQKPAVKALFAAMESAREADRASREAVAFRAPAPPVERAIVVDRLWLLSMGVKGRA